MFDFCDRIIAFPLICFILSMILLLLLLIGLLTLFGLHPGKSKTKAQISSFDAKVNLCWNEDINVARRYYGVISTLSIVNNTKYVYGLDKLCNQTGPAYLCLNLTTSTEISYLATTFVVSQSKSTMTFVSEILFSFCVIVPRFYRVETWLELFVTDQNRIYATMNSIKSRWLINFDRLKQKTKKRSSTFSRRCFLLSWCFLFLFILELCPFDENEEEEESHQRSVG